MKKPLAKPRVVGVLGFGLYGLGAALTDPGAEEFAARVRDELGIDIQDSPYRYWQIDEILARINCAPTETMILVWGSSLGANNSPVVASQTAKPIAGMWGFQASQWGAKVGVTANVAFAHFVFNPFITLGSYKPQLSEGNGTTDIYWTESWDDHPGDSVKAVQDMFLADMTRVLAG